MLDQGEEIGVELTFLRSGGRERPDQVGVIFEVAPSLRTSEVLEGNSGGDPEGPGAKYFRLSELSHLAEDSERDVLHDIVCGSRAAEICYEAAQQREDAPTAAHKPFGKNGIFYQARFVPGW